MKGKMLYDNPLHNDADIKDFILEGKARITCADGFLQMENELPGEQGQKANFVLWCPLLIPDRCVIEWEFMPVTDVGLCILFFSATGRNGEDLFSPALLPRTGEYPQYHSGDINAFHVSYFRRKEPDERMFHTCNLRKSHGFHLVAQGADPIPGAADVHDFYRLCVVKEPDSVSFSVNDLPIFTYRDDGVSYGDRLGAGHIGFRQLAPLTARYRNLTVHESI
ncbi:DUF1961 family protein [Parasphaerochaeta coccoides]|uniref:DUF1961 family protein n=1 Tax=Parasphaerochaeta coccoides (strain ATCC BAA-1237 / DSM 17374 / SPN1) TaxID=760011 RepID=F4GIW5_PARC1|nr:DUF1961 family protein [Parasphaerochaeta coccoides]AEC02733.1 Domain of unknown function DUF1961 [Parasphaerochaeta coccoides DSM 17374]